MSGSRFPLLVQFEFHPRSHEAAAAATYLHDVLNADPAVPGLQIPTYFTPDDGSGEPPDPRVATEADRVLLVLLADNHLAAAARKPTKSGTTWGEYASKLRSLTEAAGHRFMPVQLTEDAWPIDTRLSDTNFLRAWAIDGVDDRHKFIARRLVHLLIRRLRPRMENEDAPPVTIFLSHTKLDIKQTVIPSRCRHCRTRSSRAGWPSDGASSVFTTRGSLDVCRCDRPPDINESLDPSFVATPDVEVPSDTALRRFAWSRGLTVMRERQTNELGARVVVGGKLGRPENSYLGRMPGVLEESLLGIRAQRPVYLVGAFGGCARLVLDALDGVHRAELTSAYHQALPHAAELKKLYDHRSVKWDEFEAIAAELKACGMSGLKNGLTIDENRELATSRSAERIVELVLRGLQQCYPPAVAGDGE